MIKLEDFVALLLASPKEVSEAIRKASSDAAIIIDQENQTILDGLLLTVEATLASDFDVNLTTFAVIDAMATPKEKHAASMDNLILVDLEEKKNRGADNMEKKAFQMKLKERKAVQNQKFREIKDEIKNTKPKKGKK